VPAPRRAIIRAVNSLGCLLAPGLAAACGLMVSLNASAQSPPAARDLARQLSARITAAVAPLPELHLAVVDTEADGDAITAAVAAELDMLLRDRGIRLVVLARARESEPGVQAFVRLTCSANLREDVCAAEIAKGESRDVVIASRPRDLVADRPQAPLMALEVRPLFAAQPAILDATVMGERLLVLDAEGIALYERSGDRQAKAAVPLVAIARPWPRDVRGRLHVDANTLSVFLPGVSCRGTVEPLAIKCAGGNEPWPVGIPAATLEAGVNYFTSPKTPSFFSTASIGTSGGSGWLLAATDGRLLLVDESLGIRQTLPSIGDDIASVTTSCGGGRQVIAAAQWNGASGGVLRAFEFSGRNLVQVTPAVSMPGRITALWEAPGTPFVLVVAHNAVSNRYEVFQVGISCTR
jgi:hypothetical protein